MAVGKYDTGWAIEMLPSDVQRSRLAVNEVDPAKPSFGAVHCCPTSHRFLIRPTRNMPNAAPNRANQRRTEIHFTNATIACNTSEGVPGRNAELCGSALSGTICPFAFDGFVCDFREYPGRYRKRSAKTVPNLGQQSVVRVPGKAVVNHGDRKRAPRTAQKGPRHHR